MSSETDSLVFSEESPVQQTISKKQKTSNSTEKEDVLPRRQMIILRVFSCYQGACNLYNPLIQKALPEELFTAGYRYATDVKALVDGGYLEAIKSPGKYFRYQITPKGKKEEASFKCQTLPLKRIIKDEDLEVLQEKILRAFRRLPPPLQNSGVHIKNSCIRKNLKQEKLDSPYSCKNVRFYKAIKELVAKKLLVKERREKNKQSVRTKPKKEYLFYYKLPSQQLDSTQSGSAIEPSAQQNASRPLLSFVSSLIQPSRTNRESHKLPLPPPLWFGNSNQTPSFFWGSSNIKFSFTI